MVLQIETGSNNEVLRTVSKEVKSFDKKLGKLLDDMRASMISSNGMGLAAPQVGKNIRVIICLFNTGLANEMYVDMVNPVITDHSVETELSEEGCLSLPGVFDKVARWSSLTVKFFDRKGKEQVLKLDGLNASVVQHETDHLDGILFIDRVAEQMGKRNLLMG